MLHLPFLPKARCRCFLQYGKHEFVTVLQPDGTFEYRCVHCEHPAAEAIRAEEEWEVANHRGAESSFLKGRQEVPGRWGRYLPWRT